MTDPTTKSLEEESTTLKSEEQNKSLTSPPTSSSNNNTKQVKQQQQQRKEQQQQQQQPRKQIRLPRVQPSSLSLRSNISESGTTEKGLSKSVKNLFVKFSINFSLFLTKLKFIADEVLSSDEIENQIFYPTDSSSVLSEFYEDNDQDNNTNININAMTKDQNADYPIDDVRKINIEEEANEIREQNPNEPFIDGEKLWSIQNQQWLIPSDELSSMNGQLKLQKKLAEQELKHLVSTKDYSIVYNHLILKNKSLKKPMNLKDLLKVINAGWTVHKTWERAAQGL